MDHVLLNSEQEEDARAAGRRLAVEHPISAAEAVRVRNAMLRPRVEDEVEMAS